METKEKSCPQCGQATYPHRYLQCVVCGHLLSDTYIKKEITWEMIERNRMGLPDFEGQR